MRDYEKLGLFYLGRSLDPATRQVLELPLLYDARDLTTHAVCVGMTGSGKTGLGITLLEEAALDGIPAIVVDPKGDLGNLLLTFPDLLASDFEPWIDRVAAVDSETSRSEQAARQAELWRQGLADWGQDGDRIRRLREAADFALYTPGSQAGLGLSVLASFAAPPPPLRDDAELLGERVNTAVESLLGFVGIEADPIRSREHILLSTILERAWRGGTDLDLPSLISGVQSPPVERIGVLELETFYPARERFELAMTLNNLLASPGFAAWTEGEPLDIGRLLHTGSGRPRVSILSIAHLSDSERMFFVSLLLNEIVGWTRAQSGTSSLRAILYMDEVFGFLPPVAEPPSKKPLLTLLKRARAIGLGVVVATQNPVDLDYKALSNAGTWCIGRLQTERDKERLLDGLESAAVTAAGFDRRRLAETIGSLGKRVFLLNNVHENEPTLFQTRWAMSYLCGPLTREQIRDLVAPRREASAPAAPQASPPPTAKAPLTAPAAEAPAVPVLPPEVRQLFEPATGPSAAYDPHLLGVGEVRFVDRKAQLESTRTVHLLLPLSASEEPDWKTARTDGPDPDELGDRPAVEARFGSVPAAAARPASYRRWEKDLADWLYRHPRLELLRSPSTGELSRPGEEERDFRVRLAHSAREQRDEAVEKLRQRFAARADRLDERLATARDALEKEQQQASSEKLQTALSVGETMLGALLGRKRLSVTGLGRARRAARGFGRARKEAQDVERASRKLADLEADRRALEEELATAVDELRDQMDPLTEELERRVISPRRSDVRVRSVLLAWMLAD